MTATPCPVTTYSHRGVIQCTQPAGHETAHAHYRDGQLWSSWLTPAEFEAARANGDYDPEPCRCDDPSHVCDECGGEIL